MASQFISFDEAKGLLGLQDRELHAMISRGELRAFRDQGALKFRREDVEKIGAAHGAAPAAGVEEEAGKTFVPRTAPAAESLDFERGETTEPATIPSIELVGAEEEAGAIEAISPDIAASGDQTQTVGLTPEADQTAELILEGEESAGTETLPISEEATAGAATVSQAAVQPTVTRRFRRYEEEEAEGEPSHPVTTVLLVVAMVVLLTGGMAIAGGMLGAMPDAVMDFFTKMIAPPSL